jgi:outer membrane cobalamin receptor
VRFIPLLLLSSAAFAADLKGLVSDPGGGVVPRVHIVVTQRNTGLRFETYSGSGGEYSFGDLPAGGYLLSASSGTLIAQQEISLDRNSTVDIRLRLQAVSTHMQVTAASLPQTIDEIAKASDTIDSETLRDRNEHTLAQATRLVPGWRVTQLGGPGALTRILVRGLRAFDTSLLIDGFRFRDTASPQGDATAFLGDFLQMNTGRIEVLRGSGSSLYGTHAAGGLLNVITDTGASGLHGEVMAEGGGLGTARGLARLGGSAAQGRLRFTAGTTHWNVTRGVDEDDRYRNTGVHGWTQFRPSAATALSARFFGSDNFTALNGFVSAIGTPQAGVTAVPYVNFLPAPNDPDSRRAARFHATAADLTHQFSASVAARFSVQFLRSMRDNRNGPAGTSFQPLFSNSNRFDGASDVATARIDAASWRAHRIVAGYEFERERFDNLSTDAAPVNAQRASTAISQHSHALYAQDQLRLLDGRLQVSLSGRWQRFLLSRPEFAGGAPRYTGAALDAPPSAFTGDAAVSYFLRGAGTKFRSHIGNGYRAPSLYERFGTTYFGGNFSPLGDPRLPPERLVSVDGGVDQYLAGQRVRLSATYFYTYLREVIAYDSAGVRPSTDPFGRFGGYRNTGGGLARGVETQIEASPGRSVRLKMSYTFTRSQERISALIGGSIRSPRTPDHTFTAMLSQSLGRRTVAVFDFVAASDSMIPLFAGSGSRPFFFPGPRTANLSLNHDVPAGDRLTVRLYTRLENILNNTWYAEGFRTPGFWGVGGVRLLF